MNTYRNRQIGHRRRSKVVYGEYEDRSRYYRCWNCGFICDTQRDALVDRQGIQLEAFNPDTSDSYNDVLGLRLPAAIDLGDGTQIIIAGEEEDIVLLRIAALYAPVVTSGCPLCGVPYK